MPEAFLVGSKEWFQTAKKLLNDSEDLKKGTADWEGRMRCIITIEDDVAVTDYATVDGAHALIGMLSMLSEENRLQYKGSALETVLEKVGYSLDMDPASVDADKIGAKMGQLTADDFTGATIYASFEPHRGVLREMDPISPQQFEDAPFTLSGGYRYWKEMCSGRQSSLQLIMGGKMKLLGNLNYVMKRMAAVNALMEVYKSIPLK